MTRSTLLAFPFRRLARWSCRRLTIRRWRRPLPRQAIRPREPRACGKADLARGAQPFLQRKAQRLPMSNPRPTLMLFVDRTYRTMARKWLDTTNDDLLREPYRLKPAWASLLARTEN